MATTPTVHLSIGAGPAPGAVAITVYGSLGVDDVASLRGVLDGLLSDVEVVAIGIDVRRVEGDLSGIFGLLGATDRAWRQGVELTFGDPSQLTSEALHSVGLTALIKTTQRDRRPPWSVRRPDPRPGDHPSGPRLPAEGPDLDSVHNA